MTFLVAFLFYGTSLWAAVHLYLEHKKRQDSKSFSQMMDAKHQLHEAKMALQEVEFFRKELEIRASGIEEVLMNHKKTLDELETKMTGLQLRTGIPVR